MRCVPTQRTQYPIIIYVYAIHPPPLHVYHDNMQCNDDELIQIYTHATVYSTVGTPLGTLLSWALTYAPTSNALHLPWISHSTTPRVQSQMS